MEKLATRLAARFRLFCAPGKMSDFTAGFSLHCIKPAMDLHEKMLMSTNEYLLDRDDFIGLEEDGKIVTVSGAFFRGLASFNCKDILHSQKAFVVEKLNPKPTDEALRQNLYCICTIAPALLMKRVDRLDTTRPYEIIRKERIVVAWGEKNIFRKMREFEENSDPSILRQVLHSRA